MNDQPTPETDALRENINHGAAAESEMTALAGRLERERDEAREELEKIKLAAQAVVDRWEQPSWKDTEPTATVIYRLRNALVNIPDREKQV